ncbi:alpha-mannosidase [Arthrobacter mobilis]|uniref:Alpha-mannosidase n=1 Tax=Arthrobacter mobilis TaxID=2724944 RepID=A0A7X6QMK4_9MICC|nr:glycoside hydrolase family 38 C-terminal domain-containing protein [Arthrobacter mobilis]NKX56779.1 alpha-mannosidase [Arthrobacter mobilis]
MHQNAAQAEARIARFVVERLEPAVHSLSRPLTAGAWTGPHTPVPFAEAAVQSYEPFQAGRRWGAPWGTTWFRFSGAFPADGAGSWPDGWQPEALVDLGFTPALSGFQAEGLAYAADGTVLKGISPLNRHLPLTVRPGEPVTFYVEAAANPDIANGFSFAPTLLGDPATAGREPLYSFGGAWLVLREVEVWELLQDFRALASLMLALPPGLSRRAGILRALGQAVDRLDPEDIAGTAAAGQAELAAALAAPAHPSAHRIHAVGHSHIDSAWLWPVRETVRKVARTFANVLDLMDQDPGFVFAASAAQHYAWLKQHYPALFGRVKEKVAGGQFVPVGGMWVESDTNLPGGEALARQFIEGKQFFLEEFGVEPLEVWLPDSFGYSAALPQIALAAGSRWFLTQKLSWNDTNRFPHHTFAWEGIDGSRIFTHLPPVDSYSSDLSGTDLARAEQRYAEHGAANSSLVPFGWGDGGGGPTREMLAAARRTRNLEGSPTVRLSSPHAFFSQAEAEYPDPPVWSGELYLEFHRGTYTSQAGTKLGNRRCEHLLREAELWGATAAVRGTAPYPYRALQDAWRTVLLQQFHDILPGSSIAWVHREAERNYQRLAAELNQSIETSLRSLLGRGGGSALANAGPYAQDGVPALGTAPAAAGGAGPASGDGAGVTATGEGWILSNRWLQVAVDGHGLLSSIVHRATGRELIPAGQRANVLQLFRDTPNQWDAWNLDAHYDASPTELRSAGAVDVGAGPPARASLRISRSFGASQVVQTVGLAADGPVLEIETTVDWHERQKLLKLAFPLDIHAERAASEIQFGHIFRPTHTNTSWDAARFETAGQRWVHVGEPGFGVAIVNDTVYGHDIRRIGGPAAGGGAPFTRVRQSLLRAALYPDPGADQGTHTFRTWLVAGADIPGAVRAGYRLNLPLHRIDGVAGGSLEPLFTVDNPAVVIEAVKLAQDRSGDVVVRLYEAHGGRAAAQVTAGFDYAQVQATDLLERPVEEGWLEAPAARTAVVRLRPFQLATLRFRRA